MRYFSGFCLKEEEELFDFWLKSANSYTIAGFSYGAIKAIDYALKSNERVDRLILISPAYFNDKSESFKKMQLLYFKKNSKQYIDNFLENITDGSMVDLTQYQHNGTYDELKELLYYNWQKDKLTQLQNRGIEVEVILGENDKIIDSKSALDFFKNVSTTYYIKNANHILKIKERD